MKQLVSLSILLFVSLFAAAQLPETDCHPQRKPSEVARKQTEMLIRELGISDSSKIEALYQVHLKYVRMRQVSNTRAEDLERLQQLYAELKQILTPDEYERFMNHQLQGPRRPQQPVGRIAPQTSQSGQVLPPQNGVGAGIP